MKLSVWAKKVGIHYKAVKEIGSGLNDRRPKLHKLLSEGKTARIVVEHKDRLTRFGFSYIQELCKNFGCEIMVINEVEGNKEDLIQDFVWLLPVFVLEYMDNGGRDVKLRF